MRRALVLVLAVLLAGCSGSDDSPSPEVPEGARSLDNYLKSGVELMFPGVARLDGLLPFLMNPGAPPATGVSFVPDTSPGAPPNSYLFEAPLDGDSDGSLETTLTGRAVLNGDPASPGVGFGGHLDLTVESVGGLGNFTGSLDFRLTEAGTELSGTGNFSDAITGAVTSLHVDAAEPLVVAVATGAANSVGNACAYSLDGDIGVTVIGASGSLASSWGFASNRREARITDGVFTDSEEHATDLPDGSYEIPCGGGSIGDWNGVFLQDYGCLPPESGQARLTITVTGTNRIHISDEDPPGSGDTNMYDATIVSGNAHVLRGFFIAGPDGSHYREDFTWTLSDDRGLFTQISHYQYTEGLLQGTGGICSATARRQ